MVVLRLRLEQAQLAWLRYDIRAWSWVRSQRINSLDGRITNNYYALNCTLASEYTIDHYYLSNLDYRLASQVLSGGWVRVMLAFCKQAQ